MSDGESQGKMAALAVGERAVYAMSNEELANVLGLHIAQREGFEGKFKPWVSIMTLGGNVLSVEVTLRRTG